LRRRKMTTVFKRRSTGAFRVLGCRRCVRLIGRWNCTSWCRMSCRNSKLGRDGVSTEVEWAISPAEGEKGVQGRPSTPALSPSEGKRGKKAAQESREKIVAAEVTRLKNARRSEPRYLGCYKGKFGAVDAGKSGGSALAG